MSVDGEDLRNDREGFFDLDSLKPYSSVWVSTRRDAKSKSHQQDEDNDNKKNVMPSRACNNLHSLLETTDGSPLNDPSIEEIRMQVQQLSSTKSDHFPLSPYKMFEKADSVSLRKISDKIIESMCKNDSKLVFNEPETIRSSTPTVKSPPVKSPTTYDSAESNQTPPEHVAQVDQKKEDTSDEETEDNELQIIDDAELVKDKNNTEPSRISHLGGGEPQDELTTKCNLLSDNGKLVTEMNLTALNLKDTAGREFPVTVKYIWETDINEILKASDNVINSSPSFVRITESVLGMGIKAENSYPLIIPVHSGKTWQERTRSQSSCVPMRNMKRGEAGNTEDKEIDSNLNMLGSKGDASNMRKSHLKENHSLRNALIRSKVSMVGSFHQSNQTDSRDSRLTDGHRDSTRVNAFDRKALADRKNRIPVKKKFPPIEEMKMANSMARPATFNKREPAPRPAPNRPPSAPTREMTSRIPQRISIQESGDRLSQGFNKRPFGTKFQAPTHASSSKQFWK